MKITTSYLPGCFILLACALAWPPHASAADAGTHFKVLPETMSPDGAYIFAYGPDATADQWKAFSPAAEDDASVERRYLPNYLVDARARKIVATIPMINDMPLNIDSRHGSFKVGWSANGKHALAIFNGRYSSDTVMWVSPAARAFTEVSKQLKGPLHEIVLSRNGGKLAELLSQPSFEHPIIREPDVLIVRATAADLGGGGSGLMYEYVMKFGVNEKGGKVSLKLVTMGVLSEGEIPARELEPELNKIYNQLRNKLDKEAKDSLKKEQLEWLKKREGNPSESERNGLTQRRIEELTARLVEQ